MGCGPLGKLLFRFAAKEISEGVLTIGFAFVYAIYNRAGGAPAAPREEILHEGCLTLNQGLHAAVAPITNPSGYAQPPGLFAH
jgi:hypothetical protein